MARYGYAMMTSNDLDLMYDINNTGMVDVFNSCYGWIINGFSFTLMTCRHTDDLLPSEALVYYTVN